MYYVPSSLTLKETSRGKELMAPSLSELELGRIYSQKYPSDVSSCFTLTDFSRGPRDGREGGDDWGCPRPGFRSELCSEPRCFSSMKCDPNATE